MIQIKCQNCNGLNFILLKDIDYKQCVSCDKLIKLDNIHSRFEEIVKKNVGSNLFDGEA